MKAKNNRLILIVALLVALAAKKSVALGRPVLISEMKQ